MPKSDEELDRLVAEAVLKIRACGGKATHRSVRAEVNCKTVDVWNALKRYLEKEKGEEEKKLASAITPAIRAAILKDREDYAVSKTKILVKDVEQLEIACEVLCEETKRLEAARDDLNSKILTERKISTDKIRIIDQSNYQLNGILQTTQDQNLSLQDEIESIRKQRDDALKRISGIRDTFVQRNADAKAEKANVKKLREQIEKERAARNEIESNMKNAEKTLERFQGQVSELTCHLDRLREDLSSEVQLRIKAEKHSAVATAHAETLQAELTAKAKKNSKNRAPVKRSQARQLAPSKEAFDEGLGF